MALLTARKVTIFSQELLNLMSKVINSNFDNDKKICKVKPQAPETLSTMSEVKEDGATVIGEHSALVHNDSI